MRSMFATAFEVAGLVVGVLGAWMLTPVAGVFAAGAALFAVGFQLERD